MPAQAAGPPILGQLSCIIMSMHGFYQNCTSCP